MLYRYGRPSESPQLDGAAEVEMHFTHTSWSNAIKRTKICRRCRSRFPEWADGIRRIATFSAAKQYT